MRRKIEVTPAEMMELRNRGMSNHDIAKSLDISIATVRKYIGKQGGGRMERMSAFSDCASEQKQHLIPVVPPYIPTVLMEAYKINDTVSATIQMEPPRIIVERGDGSITFNGEEAADLVQFLVWASRRIERM